MALSIIKILLTLDAISCDVNSFALGNAHFSPQSCAFSL